MVWFSTAHSCKPSAWDSSLWIQFIPYNCFLCSSSPDLLLRKRLRKMWEKWRELSQLVIYLPLQVWLSLSCISTELPSLQDYFPKWGEGRLMRPVAAHEIYSTQHPEILPACPLPPSHQESLWSLVPPRSYLTFPRFPGAKKKGESLHYVGKWSWDTHLIHVWYKSNSYQHLYSTEDQWSLNTLQFFHQTIKLEPHLDVTLSAYWDIYNLGGAAPPCQCTRDSKHKASGAYFFIYTLSFLLDGTNCIQTMVLV